ncbi:phosphoribosyltransferase family protein [Salinirubellus salinus]|uniref:Phosphoribosyltransferase family protein n=1 Tax=Salinirubellus salinus TaxID=1364945 RepID=A0A9E7R6N8_9EURY|nr:phosphoribosyltransferase family protein [Salinirubellus salinus]UWM56915.1 phosphoribosyltransferase family protein [Salinirubellus salinus]UWM56917.1 phosphoribosyltransferase family protein [Salinirubellus salinus]
MFSDRTDAGHRLGERLVELGVETDVVLAVPRGGLPVGRAVADALGAPLDVVAARKLGAPGNAELAIGAVAADGTVWLNDPLVAELGIGEAYVEDAVEHERGVAEGKLQRYREGRPPLDLQGRQVVVVDDGVATGATTIACLRQVREAGAARVVLAVPVGPPDTVARLGREADEVVCLATPERFGAVGRFYDSFTQVSDEEAMGYLDPA